MMARSIEITVKSARGLNSVRTCAVGWVTRNPNATYIQTPQTHYATAVDTENGKNPIWSNGVMKFTVDEEVIDRLVLVITINAESSSPGKEIARGSLPLMAFFNSAGYRECQLPLSGPTGEPNGDLNISLQADGQARGQPNRVAPPNAVARSNGNAIAPPTAVATSNRNAILAVNTGIKAAKVGLGIARLLTGDLGGLGDMFS